MQFTSQNKVSAPDLQKLCATATTINQAFGRKFEAQRNIYSKRSYVDKVALVELSSVCIRILSILLFSFRSNSISTFLSSFAVAALQRLNTGYYSQNT